MNNTDREIAHNGHADSPPYPPSRHFGPQASASGPVAVVPSFAATPKDPFARLDVFKEVS